MKVSRAIVDVAYYLTVLLCLGILTISFAKLNVITWSQALNSLWVEAVLGVSFLLYRILWRDMETERFGAGYAKRKQELENRERMLVEIRANLHAHHESIINRMKKWKYWPREFGEIIYSAPEGVRPLLTTEPPNLENDKRHLAEFAGVWKAYSEAPQVCRIVREAEEAASNLIASRLQALNANELLTAKQEADGSFRRLTKEIVQELDAELRSSRRQTLLLKVKPEMVDEPDNGGDASRRVDKLEPADQLAELLAAVKQSEEVRQLIENRLLSWDKLEANRNAFLTRLSTDVIDRAENGNWGGLERGTCDDCRHLKEKVSLFIRTDELSR